MNTLSDPQPARETAAHLLRESAIAAVVLVIVREDKPVLEVCAR
jgi:hypothetical protein